MRVSGAAVQVGGRTIGEIDRGLLVLLGVATEDGPAEVDLLARKVAGLRVFRDDHRPLDRSVTEVGGAVLVVSQFTLLADARKGRRPSLARAAPPETAKPRYLEFVAALRDRGIPVETGEFGATMQVVSTNDGPVTVLLSTGREDVI